MTATNLVLMPPLDFEPAVIAKWETAKLKFEAHSGGSEGTYYWFKTPGAAREAHKILVAEFSAETLFIA